MGLILTDASESARAPALGGTPCELVPVANRPIVCHALASLRKAGITKLMVAGQEPGLSAIAGAMGRDRQPEPEMRFVAQDEPGALAGIRATADLLDDGPFLVQYGDAL